MIHEPNQTDGLVQFLKPILLLRLFLQNQFNLVQNRLYLVWFGS